MVFNKLVRDKIPAIIEDQGGCPVTRILDQKEYIRALEAKLDEETEEFHRDRNAEELADILEVVFALAEDLGVSQQELMELRREKAEARGGFRDRVFLVSNEREQ